MIIAKFLNPTGAGTWYATEYNTRERIFFGYASIFGDWNDEWGYFFLWMSCNPSRVNSASASNAPPVIGEDHISNFVEEKSGTKVDLDDFAPGVVQMFYQWPAQEVFTAIATRPSWGNLS